MIPDASLAALTEIDWIDFLKASQKLLGRSVTDSLDKLGATPVGLAAYLATIAEFKKPKSDPIRAVRYDMELARHASLTFLVHTTPESLFEIMGSTGLAITPSRQDLGIAIVTGTLQVWQASVVTCCKESVTFETRLLFDKIYLLIDKLGLSEMWSQYGRRKLSDQTFVFEPK